MDLTSYAVFKGILLASKARMGEKNMAFEGILDALMALLPGQQTIFGRSETPHSPRNPLTSVMASLAEIIPGEQPFLGEVRRAAPTAIAPPVKSWNTGTTTMYLLMNGKIGCYKKNGVWKEWRPARHIVVPRNPRIGTLLAADRRINKMMTRLGRRVNSGRRRSVRTRVLPSAYLSAAERKLLGGGN